MSSEWGHPSHNIWCPSWLAEGSKLSFYSLFWAFSFFSGCDGKMMDKQLKKMKKMISISKPHSKHQFAGQNGCSSFRGNSLVQSSEFFKPVKTNVVTDVITQRVKLSNYGYNWNKCPFPSILRLIGQK